MTKSQTTPLVIVGSGGHGSVVAALAERAGYSVAGFLDCASNRGSGTFPILGTDEYLDSMPALSVKIAMGLGASATWDRRRALCEHIENRGFVVPRLIDPDSTLASTVEIGIGTQVLMGARVQQGVSIEDWCIVNTAAVIEHGCLLQANVHVAPGAVLCGGVTVGEGAYIGAGSVVKEGVSIGSWAKVGLGAAVISDVADGQTVVGVPAKEIDGE